jgi:hypothetical protein
VTAPDAEQITAFFGQVASGWDEMRLAYYDESVSERLAAAADVRIAGQAVEHPVHDLGRGRQHRNLRGLGAGAVSGPAARHGRPVA